MWWNLTATLTLLATISFAARTGGLRRRGVRLPELVGRVGITVMLIGVSAGAVVRATEGDPFRWFHAVLLAGGIVAVAGYVAMVITGAAAEHRYRARSSARSSAQHR